MKKKTEISKFIQVEVDRRTLQKFTQTITTKTETTKFMFIDDCNYEA